MSDTHTPTTEGGGAIHSTTLEIGGLNHSILQTDIIWWVGRHKRARHRFDLGTDLKWRAGQGVPLVLQKMLRDDGSMDNNLTLVT